MTAKDYILYGLIAALIALVVYFNTCNKPVYDNGASVEYQHRLEAKADSLVKSMSHEDSLKSENKKLRDLLDNANNIIRQSRKQIYKKLNNKINEIDNQKFDRDYIDAYLRNLDSSAAERQRQHDNDNIHY